MPPIVQLSFELPEPATDHLEALLAEELERDASDSRDLLAEEAQR